MVVLLMPRHVHKAHPFRRIRTSIWRCFQRVISFIMLCAMHCNTQIMSDNLNSRNTGRGDDLNQFPICTYWIIFAVWALVRDLEVGCSICSQTPFHIAAFQRNGWVSCSAKTEILIVFISFIFICHRNCKPKTDQGKMIWNYYWMYPSWLTVLTVFICL